MILARKLIISTIYLALKDKRIYIETYGCQMNFSDSEIVASVMTNDDHTLVEKAADADVIFLNTCSIRDHAEQRVLNRLRELQHLRRKRPGLVLGVIGCMAERLKEKLLEDEQLGMRVDMVAGPDAIGSCRNCLRMWKAAGRPCT